MYTPLEDFFNINLLKIMSHEELWNSVLAELEINTTKASFITWFQYVFLTDIKDGLVFISVPDSFTKEWVENKFSKIILKILRNLSPEIRDLRISINPTNKPNPYFTHLKTPKNEQRVEKPSQTNANQLGFLDFEINKDSNLNPKYTFDNFIIGSFNELAYAAAISVSKNPGKAYNPLFIYGPSGVGKTHLLQAVGNELLKHNPKLKTFFVPSEKFTSELINSLQNQEINKFKEKYKKIDLLIIDDIQFLAGKEKTQEEFFYIFKELYEENKQIILSSDRPPKSINTLEDRLRSRFEGGMIADIGFPDYETRVAILKSKANQQNLSIPDDVLHYIASQYQKNIRELEGALNTINANAQLNPSSLTIQNISKTLFNTISSPRKIVNHKQIIKIVADFYDVSEKELLEKTRKQDIVKPRQIAMYLLRQELKSSFPFIGQKLGGRDHTTAIHACNKIEKGVESDLLLNEEINLIKQRIYS